MTRFLFLLICFSGFTALAVDPKYPVSTIKPELVINANAVFRKNASVFTISGQDKATHHVHQVITILNARAKDYAAEAIGYDKLRKIRSITAAVYDAEGKLLKKLKDKDIEDHSATGDDLFSDDRFKYFDLSQGTYPYTIEIEYEVDYKYLFHIPSFAVMNAEDVSCESGSYTLKFPADLKPRVKVSNVGQRQQEFQSPEGLAVQTWNFENVLPIKAEAYGPPFVEIIPRIVAAPSAFEYDNYVGKMNTWDEYAKWISSLNHGRNILPQATKSKVLELVKNATTREEKIRMLYAYLQSKTRYVSIQLGIGGYQPFEASVVDQNGYGDCKALSNYMMALLDAASIPSYYALINSGYAAPALDENFPSSQFDHVLVAVPNDKDTLWLECTSQSNPFGYQGFHTGDRKALLITERGAKIVRTKHYSAEENLQSRFANVYLQSSGDGSAKIKTSYSGLQYEAEGASGILNAQEDQQRKWILDNTRIPTFDLSKWKIEGNKDRIPTAVLTMELELRRYCTVSGKRLFLLPNLMNKSTFIPEKVEQRKSKIVRHFSYVDVDTIQYHIPESLYPEVLPEPMKVTSRFGEYECSYKLDQGSIIYVRKLKIFKGEFAPETYNEYAEFFKKINRADNTKIVFLSKT